MSNPQWTDAAAESDIPDDDVIGREVEGREVALYKTRGEIYATDNICSHGQAELCDGFLEGYEIECPMHQGRFDIRNGQPACAPVTEAIRSYPVKIEGGRVFLALG
ncbi:non-heme iron oxygenase ferredoxin subunit [Piscinibacter sakaiensis]|uniref:non-heme iron oxygenase ferredoxin subunit n=1 Tax=Piscinibacter sakaiensis TaxID=1547922 RepID=UPI003AAA95B5